MSFLRMGPAKAIEYSFGRWAALTRYLEDVPSTTHVENRIRPAALGRSYVPVIIMRWLAALYAGANAPPTS
jgi:hypothetical protein